MTWIAYWPVLVACWMFVRAVRARFRSAVFDSSVEASWLLALIFSGGAVTAGANLDSKFGRALGFDTTADVWSLTRNNYEFTEEKESMLAPNAVIDVVNCYGDVEIRREVGPHIHVAVRKIVRASSAEEASRMSEAFLFRLDERSGKVRVSFGLDDDSHALGRQRYRSRLSIVIPPDAVIHVEAPCARS